MDCRRTLAKLTAQFCASIAQQILFKLIDFIFCIIYWHCHASDQTIAKHGDKFCTGLGALSLGKALHNVIDGESSFLLRELMIRCSLTHRRIDTMSSGSASGLQALTPRWCHTAAHLMRGRPGPRIFCHECGNSNVIETTMIFNHAKVAGLL